MDNNIFREKAIDRIKSPDALDEYIKVANHGTWMCLVAILVFVVGGIIFSIFGNLESKVPTAVVVSDNDAVCYLCDEKIQYVSDDMWVEIGNVRYKLGEHSSEMKKLRVDDEDDEKLLYIMGNEADGWYYSYPFEVSGLEEGTYKGEMIIDSVRPISFLINGK
ncbi:MAG: hypothetical protein Q4D29_06055 [Lachnospiraceae bacterium]|nr:hypothetical protein [Lachnospiraceae bacterium]